MFRFWGIFRKDAGLFFLIPMVFNILCLNEQEMRFLQLMAQYYMDLAMEMQLLYLKVFAVDLWYSKLLVGIQGCHQQQI